jgi:hypothetical protein
VRPQFRSALPIERALGPLDTDRVLLRVHAPRKCSSPARSQSIYSCASLSKGLEESGESAIRTSLPCVGIRGTRLRRVLEPQRPHGLPRRWCDSLSPCASRP